MTEPATGAVAERPPHPGVRRLEPARWLARRRAQLALRADVAARDGGPALPRLSRGQRRMARALVPPARRARRAGDDAVLPAVAARAPAPGQAQPAPETRLHEHLPLRGARRADRSRDLQAGPVRLAHRTVRRVPGGALLALLGRVDLHRVHFGARGAGVHGRSGLAAGDTHP